MLQKIIFSTIVASVVSVSAVAMGSMGCGSGAKGAECGQKDGMHKKMGGAGMSGGCCNGAMSLSTIKLTEAQQTKIESINEEFRMQMAKLHIKEKRSMDPFVNANGFDKEVFKKEASEKMNKHIDLQAEKFAKIWAILTPEQQKSITTLAK